MNRIVIFSPTWAGGHASAKLRVLVLGGYGLIGAVVVRRLIEAGHAVVGLGRNVREAEIRMPDAEWRQADLARLTTPEDWSPVLREARPSAIVNCAGVLQDGLDDDVAKVQSVAMRALFDAAPRHGVMRFIQISAPRAAIDTNVLALRMPPPHPRLTIFMRTKGEADAALQASALDWVVLRPGLVIAREAYGGNALLRALSAVPLVQPLAFADQRLPTVGVDDVAGAVLAVLDGRVTSRRVYDLVEDHPRTMAEVIRRLRAWQGLPPAPEVHVPLVLVRLAGRVADGLGWLGWRSPWRTTALTELAAGVGGDPAPWRTETGASLTPLDAVLRGMPATVQERWFSRMFLLKPLAIFTLSAFWIVTGLVALAHTETAARVLTSRGIGADLANTFVVGGALADLMLGLAVIVRRWLRPAAQGMIGLTMLYLLGGTLLAPDLWSDPLGPLVKTIPAMVLALVVLALAEDR